MITNKDIRVENGYLIINGNKYPLDGQSPEAIMQIVEDNSDTTPTENSDAPITSGGTFTAIKGVSDTIGDITQTGVTGSTVAAQLETIGDNVDALNTITAYTVSDITDVHSSITINELSIRKIGKIVTLGINFSVSASISVFTMLFKLPSGIKSFGRTDSIGVFTTKALQATLSVTSNGEVLANTSIDTGNYYNGQITFILNET